MFLKDFINSLYNKIIHYQFYVQNHTLVLPPSAPKVDLNLKFKGKLDLFTGSVKVSLT